MDPVHDIDWDGLDPCMEGKKYLSSLQAPMVSSQPRSTQKHAHLGATFLDRYSSGQAYSVSTGLTHQDYNCGHPKAAALPLYTAYDTSNLPQTRDGLGRMDFMSDRISLYDGASLLPTHKNSPLNAASVLERRPAENCSTSSVHNKIAGADGHAISRKLLPARLEQPVGIDKKDDVMDTQEMFRMAKNLADSH